MSGRAVDTTTLNPPAALGVIGGGQLGRMFVQAAERMGYQTVVLCAKADAPAAQVAHEVVVGKPGDLDRLRKFADRVDAVTVEFENVSAPALRWLSMRMPVRPDWRTVRVSQNRFREKTFLEAIGVPVAPWRAVRSKAELTGAVDALGLPLILKTAASGYDGKGQIRLEAAEAAPDAWSTLKQVPCVAERVVSFAAEVSCIVARGRDGQAVTYPICLNRHTSRHILDATISPAPIGPVVSLEAADLARSIAGALGTVGVLTVEFFLTADGFLLVNELAPRPHNSGHLTIEAAITSQYEQQVRALCNLPLGCPSLIAPAAMVNLLGDLWTPGDPSWSAALAADPGVKLHLYGKRTPTPGRKMGHLTVIDPDPNAALTRALVARRALQAGHS